MDPVDLDEILKGSVQFGHGGDGRVISFFTVRTIFLVPGESWNGKGEKHQEAEHIQERPWVRLSHEASYRLHFVGRKNFIRNLRESQR